MSPVKNQRTCRECGAGFDKLLACDASGNPAPRGSFCKVCGESRKNTIREESERREANVLRNLWTGYRGWWKHYTPPLRWEHLLRIERAECPYCGVRLPDQHNDNGSLGAVLDHMDPIFLGGEDSLRIVVYCCSRCNSRKKNKLFINWLGELDEPFKSNCRSIYMFKHQHSPEAFEVGDWGIRTEGAPDFLEMDERQFRKAFSNDLPLSKYPPALYLMELLRPDPGPVIIAIMFIGGKSVIE